MVALKDCGYHVYYQELPGEVRVLRFWHRSRRLPKV